MGALAKDIVSGGTSAGSAQAINGRINPSLSAAGTTIGTATVLAATVNLVTTVAASSGVQLPSMMLGDECEVYNGGANALKVYPDQTTVGINAGSVSVAISLPINTACKFRKVTSTQIIAFLSA